MEVFSIDPIAERIFVLADKQFPEQKAFAAAIRESPSKVSQWRMGIVKSYSKQLPQIAEVLGVSVQWLVTGEELPQSKPPTPVSGEVSAEQRALLQAYEKAVPEVRAAARRVLGIE